LRCLLPVQNLVEKARFWTVIIISNKNIARLEELAGSSKERIAEHAALVLEIARIKPYKRKRLKMLARTRRDLLMKLEDTGLIFAHHW